MLNPEDRRAIEGLFDRLADVERRNPERDPEAQELIDREIVRQPGAPYYMAQTILVQQHALEVAERRIAELERQAEERGRGGMFGGLFDDGHGRQNRYEDSRQVQRNRNPWDRREEPGEARAQRGQMAAGGGFLAGAAQTALGVAGGVLLGSAIGSLFGAGGANAAESSASDGAAADAGNDNVNDQDQGAGQDGGDHAGGDWGDFGGGDGGGFDMGGDF
ncbi:DUF2076 domain-containing protein [Devosia sp. A16]|uniref:DUF2076 domain-containing protein n=1 Tax=Devosia sp. A16 TaxID=1736675 RepID=UPI0006D76CB1|nr:DUF2076 domain-containing protein [Devosia sp. A16]